MLEWYARDLTLEGLMSQCESLVISLAGEAARRHQLSPWWCDVLDETAGESCLFERLSVREAFSRYAHIDLNQCHETQSLREAAREAGIRESALEGEWDEIYFQIFMDLVEPRLGRSAPTFLYEFPASQAALAKLDPNDPRWARRFELFADGVELANAFDELSDPVEQRARFIADLAIREQRGAQLHPIDELLLERLSVLGQCVGIALGFDRLIMSLFGADHIDLVRLQPWGAP